MQEFTHPQLDQPVEFFGGYYSFIEEGTFTHRGRDVVYLVGVATVETSCCGRGGFGFIKIPGYIESWKERTDPQGQPISGVERIHDEREQEEIRRILKEKYPIYGQIEFL